MSDLSAATAVIVDEHPLWLEALERLLDRLHLQVVGTVTRASDAERLIAELRPDLVVTDYSAIASRNGEASSPGWSPVRARQANPEMRCVVLADVDDPREREQAFAAGANVFCVKRAQTEDLAAAIRQSFDHSIYFAQSEVPALKPAKPGSPDGYSTAGLTKRELEILRLVAEGHSNSQLAQTLWVTEQTIKFHLSNIYRKLGVANRTEASRWAQLHGVLEDHDLESAVA